MDIAHLKSVNKTIGAKQTLKQIAKGAVKYVFSVVRVALRCGPQL